MLCFCPLPLWHSWDIRRKPCLARRTGGICSWGDKACLVQYPSILHLFPLSVSLAPRERCWLGKAAATGAGREGGRRERQRRRGEEEEAGAEDISPAFQGHMEPRACAGGQAERVVQPVFRQGYLLSKSSWLFCLSCVTREVGVQAGEWQELDAV